MTKSKVNFTILGIETSCDETAGAVLKVDNGKFKILSNVVLSQIDIHKKFGGIVPEVAARQHIKNILPVIDQTLKTTKIKADKIDLISVTTRPGLITSLLVGIETAKTLSYVWQKPIVGIDHLRAHIYANWLTDTRLRPPRADYGGQTESKKAKKQKNTKVEFPALGLIVSGGHTQLVLMKNKDSFKIIGETLDDAAGECFDKVAKILGLSYPGGPIISKIGKDGNPQAIDLPRPMIKHKNFDFSFSGLKTAVLYKFRKHTFRSSLTRAKATAGKQEGNNKKRLSDWCASFEQAVVDVLVDKTIKAGQQYKVKTILLAGGVAANQRLRDQLKKEIKKQLPNCVFQLPAINLCTDNAVMIAVAGYFKFKKFGGDDWRKLIARPN